MFLFPFKRFYLSLEMGREQVVTELEKLTYLSDAAYAKGDDDKKLFYGIVNREEFELENLHAENRLVPFITGEIRGIEQEIYIFIWFKAYRHARTYLLYVLFLLSTLAFLAYELTKKHSQAWKETPFIILSVLIFIFILYLCNRLIKYKQLEKNSLDFFRGLLNADAIEYSEVPSIFRL